MHSVGSALSHVPYVGIWIGLVPAVAAPLKALIKYGEACVARRLSQGSKTHDLFHFLVFNDPFLLSNCLSLISNTQSNEDQPTRPPPPVRDLVNDGVLVVVAGSDTVASALTSLFFCLLTHPKTYDTLQKEVDQRYPRGEDAYSPQFHRDMPYLHAAM